MSKVSVTSDVRYEIHMRVVEELIEPVDSLQYLGIILDQTYRKKSKIRAK